MARTFNGSTSNIKFATPFVSTIPVTMMAWARVDPTATGELRIFGCQNSANSNPIMSIGWNPAENADGFFIQYRNTAAQQSKAVGVTNNIDDVWHHVCGTAVVNGANVDTEIFLDGTSDGTTSAVSNGTITVNHVDIGVLGRVGDSQFWNGEIAECAAWNVVLSDAEIAILALGVCPMYVQPQSLVFYSPLRGQVRELTTRNAVSVNTATSAFSHPKMRYPASRVAMPFTVVPPPATTSSQSMVGGLGRMGQSFSRLGT